jgi:hypothetical protein
MATIRSGIALAVVFAITVGAQGCSKKPVGANGANTGSGGPGSVPAAGGGPVAGGTTGAPTSGAANPSSNDSGGAPASGSGGSAPASSGSGGAPASGTSAGTMDAGTRSDGATPSDAAVLADGEVPPAQCEAKVMAAGTTITDCERCLCQPGHCQAQLQALEGDTKANALIACTKKHNCDTNCCLCGAPCDSLGANYGMGPCAAEFEAAAGATPGAGLSNVSILMMNCPPMSTDPKSSCVRASALGQCAKDKCADACPAAPTCQ